MKDKYAEKKERIQRRKPFIMAILLSVGFIFCIPSISRLTLPRVINRQEMKSVLEESEYEAFGTIDIWDNLEINSKQSEIDKMLASGIDKDLWMKSNIYAKEKTLWRFENMNRSVVKLNEDLEILYDKMGESDISALDISPNFVDGKKVFPPSEKIINSKIPAVQLFDIYIPTNSTLTEEELAAIVNNSQEDIKLVEVKWKEKGTEDPQSLSDGSYLGDRYIVYSDTAPDEYASDYLLYLSVNTYDIPGNLMMADFVTSVRSVSDRVSDNFYITGGKHVEESSIFNKIKHSFGVIKGDFHALVRSLKVISMFAFLDLIVLVVVFPLLVLVVIKILEIVMNLIINPVLAIICIIIDYILEGLARLMELFVR